MAHNWAVKSGLQMGGLGWLHNLYHWRDPNASKPGRKSLMGHKGAVWQHNPGHLGGSPMLQSEGEKQQWRTNGRSGAINPAIWGVANTSERGTKSAVAKEWVDWPHNPCRLGGPKVFR